MPVAETPERVVRKLAELIPHNTKRRNTWINVSILEISIPENKQKLMFYVHLMLAHVFPMPAELMRGAVD